MVDLIVLFDILENLVEINSFHFFFSNKLDQLFYFCKFKVLCLPDNLVLKVLFD